MRVFSRNVLPIKMFLERDTVSDEEESVEDITVHLTSAQHCVVRNLFAFGTNFQAGRLFRGPDP